MRCQAGERRFLRWKTVFSALENAVFTVVNAFGESFDVTTLPAATPYAQPLPSLWGGVGGGACHLPYAQPPPSLSGRGWGWGFAATSHLAATTRICLKHRGFGRLVAEWQQILQNF